MGADVMKSAITAIVVGLIMLAVAALVSPRCSVGDEEIRVGGWFVAGCR
jgi:hypothetical protein